MPCTPRDGVIVMQADFHVLVENGRGKGQKKLFMNFYNSLLIICVVSLQPKGG